MAPQSVLASRFHMWNASSLTMSGATPRRCQARRSAHLVKTEFVVRFVSGTSSSSNLPRASEVPGMTHFREGR
eukprot:5467667-Alexandrium_andersonii.AAC.1